MWSWVCECPLASVFLVLFLLMIRTSVSSYQSHDFKGFVLQSFFFFFDCMCKQVYTALEIGKLYQ